MNIMIPDAGGLPTIAGSPLDGASLDALQKALTAGYGTDSSQFTGGSAFRIQSLDKTMKSTIQERKNFVLFNMLAKQGAGATVDEWTERSDIGGFLGGTTNGETGNIQAGQGQYARQTAIVKYLMTRCEVSFVATLGNNIVSAKAAEGQAGALRLLTDAEYLGFYGNSGVNPLEFDGIFTQILNAVSTGYMGAEHVIDLNGASLTDINPYNQGASTIAGYGNFGEPSHFFCSFGVQRDLDASLDPAWRVPLANVPDGGIKIGSPVSGIRTSFGDIATAKDVFILDEPQLMPFQAVPKLQPVATANAGMTPAGVAVATAGSASSRFTAARAGNYYWLICGLNQLGQSTGVLTAQTAVASGQSATLTIQPSASGAETGYAIYRSRQNGTSAPNDLRLMSKIPKAGVGNTVYVDNNLQIPGSTTAAMVNMNPGADNISWRQLLPMTEFQLYPTQAATMPWAQLLFGYLRIAKRKQNVVYINVVPTSAVWQPFVPGA